LVISHIVVNRKSTNKHQCKPTGRAELAVNEQSTEMYKGVETGVYPQTVSMGFYFSASSLLMKLRKI
jgi:hypothetical protein